MDKTQIPEAMAEIQKIQRHPGASVNAPARIGPMTVAKLGLQYKQSDVAGKYVVR